MPILRRNKVGLIHIAALLDSFETFLLLLSLGVSIRQTTLDGYLPIHYACEGGAIECTAYIIARDKEAVKINTHLAIEHVWLATWAKSAEILELFFRYGIDFQGTNLFSQCVWQAISSKATKCLLKLLEHGEAPTGTRRNLTPLMKAVTVGFNDAILPLISAGGDPLFENVNGDTALSIACKLGNVEAVRILLSGMSKVERPESSMGVIHWACQSDSPEILEMILQKGCDIYRRDSYHRLAHVHLPYENPAVALKMLETLIRHGFDLNKIYDDGRSYVGEFLCSAIRDSKKVVKFLLENGPEPDAASLKRLFGRYADDRAMTKWIHDHFPDKPVEDIVSAE